MRALGCSLNGDLHAFDDSTYTTTAKVVVARIREPAAEESTPDVRTSVHKAYEPAVADLERRVRILALADAEFLVSGQRMFDIALREVFWL